MLLLCFWEGNCFLGGYPFFCLDVLGFVFLEGPVIFGGYPFWVGLKEKHHSGSSPNLETGKPRQNAVDQHLKLVW